MPVNRNLDLLVLNCLHRAHFGGAQWRVVSVGERLSEHGVRTTVLFPATNDTDYEKFLSSRRFPYVRVPMPYARAMKRVANNLRFLADLPFQVARILKLIRLGAYDVVHVNGATNIAPVLAAVLAGRPALWHWNDTLTPLPVARLVGRLLNLPGCWLVVASSAVWDRYPLGAYARRFLGVIPPPILPSPPSAAPVQPSDRRDIVIGFVGHLVEAKGTFEFVATIKSLAGEGLPVVGMMVGEALSGQLDHAKELSLKIDHEGIGDRIRMTGYRNDVQDVMRSFDVLLFPSRSEAAPIVFLQALMQGIPTVATDVGNVREVADGLDIPVVPVGDVAAMVAGVKRMLALTQDQRDAFAQAARSKIEATFSLAAIVERHLECYDRVVVEVRRNRENALFSNARG
jgi:glycosyltransferase involved in cell wall biosynthesis